MSDDFVMLDTFEMYVHVGWRHTTEGRYFEGRLEPAFTRELWEAVYAVRTVKAADYDTGNVGETTADQAHHRHHASRSRRDSHRGRTVAGEEGVMGERLTDEERAEGRRLQDRLDTAIRGPSALGEVGDAATKLADWNMAHVPALLDAADDVARLEAERDTLLARLATADERIARGATEPTPPAGAAAASDTARET